MARVARIALDLALSASKSIKPAVGTAWTYAKMEMAPPMTVNFLHGPTFKKVENAVSSAADGFMGALDGGIKKIDAFEAKRALEREAARKAALEKQKADAEAKKKEEEELKRLEQEEIDKYKCTPEKGAESETVKKEGKVTDTKQDVKVESKDIKDEKKLNEKTGRTKKAKSVPKNEKKGDGVDKGTTKVVKSDTKTQTKTAAKGEKPTIASASAEKKKEPARRKEPKTSRRETKKGSAPKPNK
ncbi:unnamed protein product [Plutella xylostella]|uniref:(diamondback moth) hypothetical protein n=1 Tax=Plutella xylostella TaxID=51655 RepID=A0A8S4E5C4_PLUXY|nr:unnamed protein product [Plutella xylostella]